MKSHTMNLPDNFSNPFAQGLTAVICWVMAYHIPSHLLSVFTSFDMILTILLKVLGGAATLTTLFSFYFKNEVRIKRILRIFKRRK